MSYQVEALKKKRDQILKKARKTGRPEVLKKVKELNDFIKKSVKTERERLLKSKMKDHSPSTFWHTVYGLLGHASTSDVYPVRNEMGEPVTDEESIQMFADFFKKKVVDLADQNPIEDAVMLQYEPIEQFSEDEIRNAVSTFKSKRSSGPDEVPLVVMKDCLDVLVGHLDALFKLITDTGKIPKVWKTARIKPIFKKSDRT